MQQPQDSVSELIRLARRHHEAGRTIQHDFAAAAGVCHDDGFTRRHVLQHHVGAPLTLRRGEDRNVHVV